MSAKRTLKAALEALKANNATFNIGGAVVNGKASISMSVTINGKSASGGVKSINSVAPKLLTLIEEAKATTSAVAETAAATTEAATA